MKHLTRTPAWLEILGLLLDERREGSNWRAMRVRAASADSMDAACIDLASNDYLRLATHPHLIECVSEAASRWGVGSGSSRLVAGTLPIHAELEERFARFKRSESCLVLPTGYMANLGVLSSLPRPEDLLVLDKFCHASLIDGARLATTTGAILRTFPHRRLDRLRQLLAEHRDSFPRSSRFIVTDSVFSMDGDCADLNELALLRDEFDAALILDEAHATGVLGERGEGLDSRGVADVVISTASKALGSLGGLVTGPRNVIDWLVNSARTLIYTTAAAPTQAAAILAALDVIASEPERRQRLAGLSRQLREAIRALGIEVSLENTPIIPIVVGSEVRALALSQHLGQHRILAPAIRPPTVPRNGSRVRLSVHSELNAEEMEQIVRALETFDWSR